MTEKFLLPAGANDAQRQAIVRQRARQLHGISSQILAVFPGEDGWVRQLGNTNGVIYFGVVSRQCSPSLPHRTRRRDCW